MDHRRRSCRLPHTSCPAGELQPVRGKPRFWLVLAASRRGL